MSHTPTVSSSDSTSTSVDGIILLNGITLAEAQGVNAVLAVGPMTEFGPTFYIDNTGAVFMGVRGSFSVSGADGSGQWQTLDDATPHTAIQVGVDGQIDLTDNKHQFNADNSGYIAGNTIAWDGSGNIGIANENIPANGGIGTTLLKLKPRSGSGAPGTGAHEKGEVVMDSAGALFVCQADGSPGTWKTVTLT